MVTDYMSVNEASKKWGISVRCIQKLCAENRIDGAVRFSRVWAIPRDAQKPIDGRLKSQRKMKQNRA
ncbi:MAG: DNA-binding protein [Minisyncoccia bacterium]